MGDVTAVMMDVITEKSGHQVVPNAVSVCITPAAPSPLPIPYPVIAQVGEGITDPPMRTKVNGSPIATTGSVLKACHGNEPGTLKEVVSLNTGGPVFIIVGAPNVFCELGMMGITLSMCISNKAITVGAGANASDAGGAGGSGGGAGGGGAAPSDSSSSQSPSNAGGGGGGTANSGASAAPPSPHPRPTPEETALAAAPGDSPEQRAARDKLARNYYHENCTNRDGTPLTNAQIDSHVRCIDNRHPVDVVTIPPQGAGPNGDRLHQHTFPGRTGQYFTQDTTTTADQVGANPRVLMPADGNTPPRVVPRQPETYTVSSDQPASGLRSTAAPANDTWSHPGEPRQCAGGGTQIMVPAGNNQAGVQKH